MNAIGMKKYAVVAVFAVVSATLVAILHLRQGSLHPGPLPTEVLIDPLARETAARLHGWLGALREQDARRLNSSGKVLFTWEDLQRTYPEAARVVRDYWEQMRVRCLKTFGDKFKQMSKPMPASLNNRLGVSRPPDTVEVDHQGGGKYTVIIRSKRGMQLANLQISD